MDLRRELSKTATKDKDTILMDDIGEKVVINKKTAAKQNGEQFIPAFPH